MTLTKSLGQVIADLSPNRLPEQAARIARLGFVDTIGTMIAGRNEDSVRIMTATLAPADGSATLTFTDRHAPAPEAAQLYDNFADCLAAGESPIPADILFQRLSAIQSINARDLTASVARA